MIILLIVHFCRSYHFVLLWSGRRKDPLSRQIHHQFLFLIFTHLEIFQKVKFSSTKMSKLMIHKFRQDLTFSWKFGLSFHLSEMNLFPCFIFFFDFFNISNRRSTLSNQSLTVKNTKNLEWQKTDVRMCGGCWEPYIGLWYHLNGCYKWEATLNLRASFVRLNYVQPKF